MIKYSCMDHLIHPKILLRFLYIQNHTNVEVLDPGKLVSEGIGQWRPADTNDTAEGRAANRRVEMIVSGRDIASEMEHNITQYETGTD